MTTIERLSVDLQAQTRDFDRKMKTAEKRIESLEAKVRSKSKAMKTSFDPVARSFQSFIIGAAAATVSFDRMVRVVTSAAQSIDRLAKTSRRLGVDIESFAGLELLADRAGVKTRELELGLQRMTRRVSEAAKGMGEAQGALRELGIEATSLTQLAPDKQFAEIARRLSEVKNQSDRVRLAFKLFDSEGVRLLQVMEQGADKIEDAAAEARKFGIAVNEIEAKKVEDLNDSVADLRASIRGLGTSIATELAEPAAKEITRMTVAVRILSEEIRKLDKDSSAAADSFLLVANPLVALIKQLTKKDIDAIIDFEKQQEEAKKLNRELEEQIKKREKLNDLGDSHFDVSMTGTRPVVPDGMITPLPDFRLPPRVEPPKLEPVNSHMDEGLFRRSDELGANLRSMGREAQMEVDDLTKNLIVELPIAASIAESAMQSLAVGAVDAFADMLDGSRSASEAFADLGKSILKLVAQQALLAAVGSFGGAGGEGASGALGALGKAFGFGQNARGGIITDPTYLGSSNGVGQIGGEDGVEGVLPLGRTPSGELGVKTINNTINMTVPTNDAGSFRKSRAMIQRDLEEMLLGGAFRGVS